MNLTRRNILKAMATLAVAAVTLPASEAASCIMAADPAPPMTLAGLTLWVPRHMPGIEPSMGSLERRLERVKEIAYRRMGE